MEKDFLNCPLCGKTFEKKNFQLIEKYQNYKLYQCPKCLGQFWLPFKIPGFSWYEKDLRYSGRNKNPQTELSWGQKLFFKDVPQPGKLLDVGCGTGGFLFKAKRKGFEVCGFDFDREAVEIAKTYFGLNNVEALSIEDYFLKYPKQKFNFITLFDVLEHLDKPRETLNLIWQALEKKGNFVLTCPNRETIGFLKPHDFPPRHLTRWNETSLSRFLLQNGFLLMKIKKMPISLYYIALKIKFRYGRFLSWGIIKKMEKREVLPSPSSFSKPKKRQQKALISFLKKVAQLRDLLVFLLPSFVIYFYLLISKKSFLTLYVIAQKI